MVQIKQSRIARAVLSSLVAFTVSMPAFAEVDLSGRWAARYHEDWQERLPSPEIGDYTGLPINDAARSKADAWEESVQTQHNYSASVLRIRRLTTCMGHRTSAFGRKPIPSQARF